MSQPHTFEVHMNVLLNNKVNIGFSNHNLMIESRMVSKFLTRNPIS